MDPEVFKSAVREQWDRCAGGWDAHTPAIRDCLARPTAAMLDMAGVREGATVLDVAAGSGDQTLDIARRVGPAGFVLATDPSAAMVELTSQRTRSVGLTQVATRQADGEALGVQAGAFDAVVCRLGLMFFPRPLRGLGEMHRALRPGGGICTLVFSRAERNPCIGVLMSVALRYAGLPARDPYQPGGVLSLGQAGLADRLLREAGFTGVASTVIDAPFRLPSAGHYLQFVRDSASPIQQILSRLPPPAADAVWAEMEERLAIFATPQGWVGPNELLLTAGRRTA